MASNLKFRYVENKNNLSFDGIAYDGYVLFDLDTKTLGFNINGSVYWVSAENVELADKATQAEKATLANGALNLVDSKNQIIKTVPLSSFEINEGVIDKINLKGENKLNPKLLSNYDQILTKQNNEIAYGQITAFEIVDNKIRISNAYQDRIPCIYTVDKILTGVAARTDDGQNYDFEIASEFNSKEVNKNCIVFWLMSEILEPVVLNPFEKQEKGIYVETIQLIDGKWINSTNNTQYQEIQLKETLDFDASRAGISFEIAPTAKGVLTGISHLLKDYIKIYNEVLSNGHCYFFEENKIRIYTNKSLTSDESLKLSYCSFIVKRYETKENNDKLPMENNRKYKPFAHVPWSQFNTEDDLYSKGDVLTTTKNLEDNENWIACDGRVLDTSSSFLKKETSMFNYWDWNCDKTLVSKPIKAISSYGQFYSSEGPNLFQYISGRWVLVHKYQVDSQYKKYFEEGSFALCHCQSDGPFAISEIRVDKNQNSAIFCNFLIDKLVISINIIENFTWDINNNYFLFEENIDKHVLIETNMSEDSSSLSVSCANLLNYLSLNNELSFSGWTVGTYTDIPENIKELKVDCAGDSVYFICLLGLENGLLAIPWDSSQEKFGNTLSDSGKCYGCAGFWDGEMPQFSAIFDIYNKSYSEECAWTYNKTSEKFSVKKLSDNSIGDSGADFRRAYRIPQGWIMIASRFSTIADNWYKIYIRSRDLEERKEEELYEYYLSNDSLVQTKIDFLLDLKINNRLPKDNMEEELGELIYFDYENNQLLFSSGYHCLPATPLVNSNDSRLKSYIKVKE